MPSLLLLVLSAIPRDGVCRESVDLMELNHFYDENGRLVFTQQIFYDWSHRDHRYQVVDWRLVKKPEQEPERDWRNGGYVSTWQDGEILRQVRSLAIRETWEQFDPELVEREFLAKEHRRGLRQIKIRPIIGP